MNSFRLFFAVNFNNLSSVDGIYRVQNFNANMRSMTPFLNYYYHQYGKSYEEVSLIKNWKKVQSHHFNFTQFQLKF